MNQIERMYRTVRFTLPLLLWTGMSLVAAIVLFGQPEQARADYSYNSGCTSLADGGDYYTTSCYFEIRNNNGGGNINDTRAVTVPLPSNYDASRSYVIGVSANDTGYFTNADSHTSISLSAYRCNGSGNTCSINYPVPTQRLPIDAGISSFAVRINAIGPNGYARADIYFEFFKKSTSGGGSAPAPYFDYCSAPGPLALNQATTLGFRVRNATSITITSNTGGVFQGGGGSWTNSGLPSDYSYNLYYTPPNQYSVLTFSASGPGVSASCTASVGYYAPNLYGSISSTSITAGQSVTLYWLTYNATQTAISGFPTLNTVNNAWQSATVALGQTTTFTITASGPGGSATPVSFTVTVNPPPPPPPVGAFQQNELVASCVPLYVRPKVRVSWTQSSNASTYQIYQNGSLVGTTASTFYDIAVNNAASYSYAVRAVNAVSALYATPDRSINLAQKLPNGCGRLTVTLTPRTRTLAPSGTQPFTASVAMDSSVISTASGLTVTWSTNPTSGSINPSPRNQLQGTFTAGTTLGTYLKAVRADAVYRAPDGTATNFGTADVQIASPKATISGDVFGGSGVSGLTVDANSVVSANGAIQNVSGTQLTIPNYQPSNVLRWDDTSTTKGAKNTILAEATKLKKEHVDANHVLKSSGNGDFTIDGSTQPKFFNLNPDLTRCTVAASCTANIGSTNKATPEGAVWYVAGNLIIKGSVTFYGRGTIIVDGTVTIGDSSLPTSIIPFTAGTASDGLNGSLGILLTKTGDLTIGSSVTQLTGAYFVPNGKIWFQSNPSGDSVLTATGLFTGNTIQLDRKFATIDYDSRISALTPPGFGVVTLPAVQETNR